jgi:hypothetical protein
MFLNTIDTQAYFSVELIFFKSVKSRDKAKTRLAHIPFPNKNTDNNGSWNKKGGETNTSMR